MMSTAGRELSDSEGRGGRSKRTVGSGRGGGRWGRVGKGEGWCHWAGQGVQVMIGFHFVLLYMCLNMRDIFFFGGGGGDSGKLI